MQTHEDRDFREAEVERFWDILQGRAKRSMEHKLAKITAGEADEPVLAEWDKFGFRVTHRPDDKQGIIRISVGGGSPIAPEINYCVFRGDRTMCAHMLEQAARALRNAPEDGSPTA